MTFLERIGVFFSKDREGWLTKANPFKTASHGPQPKQGQIGLMLRLEKRLMFDGAGFVPGLDLICNPEIADATVVEAHEQEIVFIDPNVENYNTLIHDIDPNALVIVLDPNQGAVEQISAVLNDHSDLSTIHLVSHGGPGSLDLTGGTLDVDNITEQGDLIRGWSNALKENADILIYGCDVGAGEVGQEFISRLADMTGADIAASDDITGDVDKGGDWDLEATTGHIEATVFPTAAAQADFNGTLATITVTDTGDSGAGTLRQAVADAVDGDTITFDATLNGGTIDLTSGQIQFTKDLTIDGDLDDDEVADITIDANDNSRHFYVNASEVDLIGLTIQNGTDNGGWGGSIFNTGTLRIIDSTLSNNSSTSSAAVMYTTGDTTIIRSTFSNNDSNRNAGAIYHTGTLTIVDSTFSDNTAGATASSGGGAIYNSGGTLNLYSSTINDNSVANGNGGAIYMKNGAVGNIFRSTLSNNYADDDAGGIYVEDGDLTVTSSTIAYNYATNNDGGGIYNEGGNVTIYHTIVAENDGGNSDDIAGTIVSNDYNLVDKDGGATYTEQANDQDRRARLNSLADNASYPTQIHTLQTSSRANGNGLNGMDIGATGNFAAVFTNVSGATLDYTEDDGAVAINQDGDFTVTDSDSWNFDDGSLTIAITGNHDTSEDILAIVNQGTGAGEIGVDGSDVTYEGDIIGTYTGGTGANDLVITFDWQATATAVTALLQNISYENSDLENPTAGDRTITWTLDDGDTGSVTTTTADTTITITQLNDTPTDIALSATAIDELTDSSGGSIIGALTATDVDTGDTTTYSIVGGADQAKFSIDGSDNLVITDGTLDFETQDSYDVTVRITDSGSATYDEAFTITVNDINDAPTATNISAAETFTEDDAAFSLTDIVVTDVDNAETVTVTLTLSDTTAGTLSTATSNAVTSTFVGGVWTADGLVADVNTLLADVTFTPTADYDQDFTIATSITDGVAAAVTGTKNVTVTTVNDAPTATNLSSAESFTEDDGAFSLTDIVVSEVDTDETVTVTLTLSDATAGT
ncbi:MAG: DUF4347 domain-containing protein, partial [Magnetococcales bacterium]|nr:DUF4347 domain-containing protein [Magnetococcales bacterium]